MIISVQKYIARDPMLLTQCYKMDLSTFSLSLISHNWKFKENIYLTCYAKDLKSSSSHSLFHNHPVVALTGGYLMISRYIDEA